MNSNTSVTGLQEVIAALRQSGDPQRVDFELHASLAPVVGQVRDRAAGHARQLPTSEKESRSKGGLAGSIRVEQLKNGLAVRARAAHGGVQEFAKHYERRQHTRKNKGGGSATVRSHQVTMHDQATPRFLYRAANELDGQIAVAVEDGLTAMFRALGAEVTDG